MRDISPEIDCQAIKFNQIINNYLKSIFQEIDINYLKFIYSYFNLLDNKEKINCENKTTKIIEEIGNLFNNSIIVSNNFYSVEFRAICRPTVNACRKIWGDISWEQVVKFREEVAVKIEQRITLIFDDRLEVAKKALEQTISFYDIFLARQERYYQETPIQRQAEKAWLEQQYQKLLEVHLGLEAILN